jgi:hypothetical protein
MALFNLVQDLVQSSVEGFNQLVKTLLNEDSRDINAIAGPGLITLLDVALYRANEGELTATICSSNDLLNQLYEIKEEAVLLLKAAHEIDLESSSSSQRQGNSGTVGDGSVDVAIDFARTTICCCNGAIESIVKDGLSASANIEHSNYDDEGEKSTEFRSRVSQGLSISATSGHAGSSKNRDFMNSAVSLNLNTRRDAWESPYIICPDCMWASQAVFTCSRAAKIMAKHHFITSVLGNNAAGGGMHYRKKPAYFRKAEHLANLIQRSLPDCIEIFKVGSESNLIVSRRLYLVKCEYRGPFRAFLEAHEKFQVAPSMDIVKHYLKLHSGPSQNRVYHVPRELKLRRNELEETLEKMMQKTSFVTALELEHQCELLESDMAQMMLPFVDLSHMINCKRLRIIRGNQKASLGNAGSLRKWLRVSQYGSTCRCPCYFKANISTSLCVRFSHAFYRNCKICLLETGLTPPVCERCLLTSRVIVVQPAVTQCIRN